MAQLQRSRKKVQSEYISYADEVRSRFKTGKATEHSYRSSLQNYIESLRSNVLAMNEPRRIECGAPDYIIALKDIPVGYVEAKDIKENLDDAEQTNQLKRYLSSLTNIILTNYLEFRWYVNGEFRSKVVIGRVSGKDILYAEDGEQKLEAFLRSFIDAEVPTIRSASELALRLAGATQNICSLIQETMKLEGEDGWLHRWLNAFSEVLISDLDHATFADMFAQTLAYGFFAARIHHTGPADFSRFSAARVLPKTNPFLRQLFAEFAGVNMPDEISWAVDEIVELLKRADVQEIMKDFGAETGKSDPVVHFYETFLSAYNAKLRESRGVYYTPGPVVNYMVESVDHILEEKFQKKKGLADDGTLVLDPAVGTASFLHKVVETIYGKFSRNLGSWDSYVSEKLLDRIFGFEILMAPYSVAHLKLGMQLQQTGYKFQKSQRLGVFLTNTLEEAAKKSQELLFNWVSDEANAASSIKRDKPIMVVIGNPPYSGHSSNKGKWIGDLLKGYDSITHKKTENYFECEGKPLGERNTKWLNDDYVKFIRFAHWRIEQTGHGILAFITNHGFLDNPTFRGMRESLINTFDELYLMDLHGNSKYGESSPNGMKDENVFDIQQGVSIAFLIKKQNSEGKKTKVFKADLWGDRESKYAFLENETIATTKWHEINPQAPMFLFSKQNASLRSEYESGWAINDIFPKTLLGPNSHRDHFAISYTEQEASERIKDLLNKSLTNDKIRNKYDLKDNRDWQFDDARKTISKTAQPVRCLYRPFDFRWMLYGKYAFDYPRPEINDEMLLENLALITTKQTKEKFSAFVSSVPAGQHKLATPYDGSYLSPLYLYGDDSGQQMQLKAVTDEEQTFQTNINEKFISSIVSATGLQYVKSQKGDLRGKIGPLDIFAYIYAILSSDSFASRYQEFLKTGFPRVPVVQSKESFLELAKLGKKLISSQTKFDYKKSIVKFPKKGSCQVDKIKFDSASSRVWINDTQYFEGVADHIWNFFVGGYQVSEKWLKDRKERVLSFDEIEDYMNLINSVSMSIELKKDIDASIEDMNGWEAIVN